MFILHTFYRTPRSGEGFFFLLQLVRLCSSPSANWRFESLLYDEQLLSG